MTQEQEQLDINIILDNLKTAIANQALEIAKAQAVISNRDATIEAMLLVIETYEEKYNNETIKEKIDGLNK